MKYAMIVSGAILGATLGQAQAQEAFDCLIDPSLVIEIGSAEVGIIEDIFVGRGDTVKKGQIIATLESAAERASLAYAKARAEDTSPIEIAQAQVDMLAADAERAETLGAKKLLADAAVASIVGDYRQAGLALRQAEFEKRMAALEQTRVEAQLARRVIHSPVDGILITRMIGPGEYVFAQAPVAQVAQIDPLHIEVFLPTALYPTVAVGQLATVMPAAPVGGEYRAKIIVVDRIFDAASDTFGLRLALDNPGGALPAGIDCKVAFD